jgi:hypothetical protein
MNSEEKLKLKEGLKKVIQARLEKTSKDCKLKEAITRALDQFTLIHIYDGAECLASDIMDFLSKENVI